MDARLGSRAKPRFLSIRSLGVAALALVLGACATGTTVKQAGSLAAAGVAYGEAAKDVLDVTRERYIDWKSASLLLAHEDGDLCTPSEIAETVPISAQCDSAQKAFDNEMKGDATFIENIATLSAHAEALRKYFVALRAMVDYDAGAAASASMDRLVDQVGNLNQALGEKNEISADRKDAVGKLAALAANSIKASALRDRLHADAETIGLAIEIQDSVLESSAVLLKGLDSAARERELIEHVREPYLTNAIPDNVAWAQARRSALVPGPEIEAITKLAAASKDLADVWENIVSDKQDMSSVVEVLTQISAALDALNDLKTRKAD
jgi:hypothetical protein